MNNLKKTAVKWALLFFGMIPIIPNNIKGLPVILLLLVSFIFFKKNEIKFKYFIGYSFIYILYVFTLIYTSNIEFAYKKLETSLSILIIPFIFFVTMPNYKIEKKLKLLFAKIFIFSTSIFSSISILAIIFDTKTSYYKDFYSNKFRIIVSNLPLIGQHPIYASFFLAIAIFFTIYIFNKKRHSYLLLFLFINISLLLMLSSKGVIISLMIIIILFVIFIIKIDLRKKIYLFSFFFLIVSLIFSLNRRMQELFLYKTYKSVNTNYSNSYRMTINDCSIKLINENWLFGYGVGDAQDMLNSCYLNKSNILLKETYNSHNQYFDIWLKTGFIGFLYFILFILYLTILHLKNKNYLLVAIILLYSINFMFENILNRQSGVILFYFLISFYSIPNTIILKKINN